MSGRSACVGCFPELIPEGRLGDHHVSIRFRGHVPGLSILYDGFDVTADCVEALAGEAGWVVLIAKDSNGERFYCPSRRSRHVQVHRYEGEVTIIRTSVTA